MRDELKQLQRKLNITMLFVTHDQEEALSMSDRIVVMEKASETIGTPEIYHHPGSKYVSAFLGSSNFDQPDGVRFSGRKTSPWSWIPHQ